LRETLKTPADSNIEGEQGTTNKEQGTPQPNNEQQTTNAEGKQRTLKENNDHPKRARMVKWKSLKLPHYEKY